MFTFIKLDQEGLNILNEWFKDKEVLKRLGGMLPLEPWFEYATQNPQYFSWIVYEKNLPTGQIALEINDDLSASINILTNPEHRNKGYGKIMINVLLQRPELKSVKMIEVRIEYDNAASPHLFRQAGFMNTPTT